jgi:hypothetical protein
VDALYGGWRYGGTTAVDVDPCSNPYSKIPARAHLMLETGDNGLPPTSMPQGSHIHGGRTVLTNRDTTAFINPPYSRGQVLRWVTHWGFTNYVFLLRWDPSTEWFKVLMRSAACVWIPHQRVNFTPPPGVSSSSNPFPHALYFKQMPDASAQRRLSYLGRFMVEKEVF